MKYRFLSHTADLKIKVYGRNLEEIINNSLVALKRFLKPKLKKEKFIKEIEVRGNDLTVLLIDFLSEILVQTYIRKTIFIQFKKQVLTETKIKGRIFGYKYDFLLKDIKAITYHQAKLEKNKKNFIFEFIIDI